ncbi:MAG: Asp/Glu racemase [Alphaproteobacteria bacterium]|nr:Asp/Glu racemase [Alphaproteobacteria bacterium]
MGLLRPDGVSVHFARAGGYDLDAVPDSDQMRQFAVNSLDRVVSDLSAVRPDLVLYGCTSATLAHGPAFDREFCASIKQRAGVDAATAAGALVNALTCLGVRKIAFSSPYVAALNGEAIGFLAQSGFETVSRKDVEADLGNYGQGALSPEEVYALGMAADSAEADALVLSCTEMRAVEAIEALERDLAKPVVTSNQAMMFSAAVMLGLEPATVPSFGRLLSNEVLAGAQAAGLAAA